MWYYIVNNYGEVLGEAGSYEQAVSLMNCKFTPEEIKENEIEVIHDMEGEEE